MEVYLYKARPIGTRKVIRSEGRFESKDHVHQYLVNNNLIPLSVTRKTTFTTDFKDLSIFQSKITHNDLSIFCKQCSVMLESGINIDETLNILSRQSQNITLRKKITEIHREIQKGNSLSNAMSMHLEFPYLLVNVIKSGEVSGAIDKVMDLMATYFEKRIKLERTLKKALTYPIFILLVICLVIPMLMIFVVPGFIEIFNEADITLPISTQVVIAISQWMSRRWYILMIGLGLTIASIILLRSTRKGKMIFDKIALSLPIIGNLNKKSIATLLVDNLSLLILSGNPIFPSLESVSNVINNLAAKEELEKALIYVKEGSTISQALGDSVIYPPMMISMLRIGEETGTLDQMLAKVADYYNEEIEIAVEQLTVLIEPILIMFISIIVGGIMIAVILPTFTLATELM